MSILNAQAFITCGIAPDKYAGPMEQLSMAAPWNNEELCGMFGHAIETIDELLRLRGVVRESGMEGLCADLGESRSELDQLLHMTDAELRRRNAQGQAEAYDGSILQTVIKALQAAGKKIIEFIMKFANWVKGIIHAKLAAAVTTHAEKYQHLLENPASLAAINSIAVKVPQDLKYWKQRFDFLTAFSKLPFFNDFENPTVTMDNIITAIQAAIFTATQRGADKDNIRLSYKTAGDYSSYRLEFGELKEIGAILGTTDWAKPEVVIEFVGTTMVAVQQSLTSSHAMMEKWIKLLNREISDLSGAAKDADAQAQLEAKRLAYQKAVFLVNILKGSIDQQITMMSTVDKTIVNCYNALLTGMKQYK